MIWEAPAKVNLSLELRSPASDGMHPLRSMVQAVEWCDLLDVEEGDEDHLEIDGAELPDDGENLVWKGVTALRHKLDQDRPSLHIKLTKSIAVAAGLGGGSSDAAAAMLALAAMRNASVDLVSETASGVGADVPFFLVGGTAWIEGYGERITKARIDNESWALAIAVPDFELRTADVYQAWDRLDEPIGPALDGRALPPSLREHGPFRNDLTPAAMSLRPELGDWIAELRDTWERPVAMSGSGPSLFAFFTDGDEAESAVEALSRSVRASRAVRPRRTGAVRVS
ncbi:MAG TPA: 4-(cytidine 5'-diphospho)-2-C-methyl-D-erythritol kinase [Acidimicrobiia bacterium]|nr:4-(cytidine 5'-diphospho)-2-C-methyl-D-erythritol kinase [Acidimicrobiia bacterium]